MKRINIFKTFLLLTAFQLSSMNIVAQCDYEDIFDELETTGTFPTATTTYKGWEWKACRIYTVGEMTMSGGKITPTKLDGRITTPVFTGGCKAIRLSYRAIGDVIFKYEILKDGVSAWSQEVTLNTGGEWMELVEDNLNIDGDFQIVLSNLSNGGAQAGAKPINVRDICITSNVAQAPDPPSVSLAGIVNLSGGFWDKATVTLSGRLDASIYYTTDGSEPTDGSTLYDTPFELTAAATLKAITVDNGLSSAALDTTITVTATTYRITAPSDATVFAGDKHVGVEVLGNYLKMHYVPFREKPPVYSVTANGKTTRYYHLSGQHNYRVSRAGSLTHVGLFTPNGGELEIAEAQLTSHLPTETDHDVTNLAGRNVADVWLNINPQGHLTLPMQSDTAFQIVNCRNWQAINTDVDNYFIDPDFHYTVLDESGQPNGSVIAISDSGRITPVGPGTAIVLVTYDAMMCDHTTNVGGTPAFFGALWPENTGVFVVTVTAPGAPAPDISPNMFVNEHWNSEGADKVGGIDVDAEHDVFYYEASEGGIDYTFRPEGALAVSLAQPAVGANSLSYDGFTPVTTNADGSYTVRLVHGRNIVRLSSAGGSVYQVLTAKPVTWEVSNLTRSGEMLQPGDEFLVVFNTLYHPSNKLSGIYNMSAGIQYTGFNTEFPLILGPGQYTFASRAQEYTQQIPADYNGDGVVLTNGVIKVRGYGSFYGEHRKITKQNGVAPNLNASVRTAYFGSLPDVRIPMQGFPPSVPANLIAAPVTAQSIFLQWTASTDNVGVAGYTIWMNGDSLTSVSTTMYSAESLTPGTTYAFEVAAYDAAGNRSAKASATATTPATTIAATGVTLDRATASLNVGATLQLAATVTPASATNKMVTWTSGNEAIASVDASGIVTGRAQGTTSIAVTTVSGSHTASCSVTVTASGIAVTGVTLNRTSAELAVGQTVQLVATVLPANATNKTVTWTSSNPYVAAVNEYGLVTAITPNGAAVIIASTADGNHVATCAIATKAGGTIVNPFELTQKILSLYPGQTVALSLTAPQHFNVAWRSTNPSVATVNSLGTVTSIAAGTAQIVAEDVAQGRYDICHVTVTALPGSQTETIALNTSLLTIAQGETSTLKVTVSPGLAGKDVQWSTSNAAAANVTSTGTVVGIAPGTAVIKASIGNYSAVCAVTVMAQVKEASVDNISASEARLSFVKSTGATYYLVHIYKKQGMQLLPSFTLKVTPDGRIEFRAAAGNNLIVQLANLSPATSYIAEIESVRDAQGKAEVISSEVLLFTTKSLTAAERAPQSSLKAWTQGETLHVKGLQAGQPWSLYSISGAMIYHGVALDSEAAVILPARGVYIIRSGDNTIKVAR
jgi:uncharacterized protein YjdB